MRRILCSAFLLLLISCGKNNSSTQAQAPVPPPPAGGQGGVPTPLAPNQMVGQNQSGVVPPPGVPGGAPSGGNSPASLPPPGLAPAGGSSGESVEANVALDGNAEVSLLNLGFSPQSNCIELIQNTSGLEFLRFAAGVCPTGGVPIAASGSVSLTVQGNTVYNNATPVGQLARVDSGAVLYELGTGVYTGTCQLVVNGGSLQGIQ